MSPKLSPQQERLLCVADLRRLWTRCHPDLGFTTTGERGAFMSTQDGEKVQEIVDGRTVRSLLKRGLVREGPRQVFEHYWRTRLIVTARGRLHLANIEARLAAPEESKAP